MRHTLTSLALVWSVALSGCAFITDAEHAARTATSDTGGRSTTGTTGTRPSDSGASDPVMGDYEGTVSMNTATGDCTGSLSLTVTVDRISGLFSCSGGLVELSGVLDGDRITDGMRGAIELTGSFEDTVPFEAVVRSSEPVSISGTFEGRTGTAPLEDEYTGRFEGSRVDGR